MARSSAKVRKSPPVTTHEHQEKLSRMTGGTAANQNSKIVPMPNNSRTEHRCSLYRVARNVLPGKDLLTEVWDSVQEPRQPAGLPPEAELVESFTGDSLAEVREKVDLYRLQNRTFLRGDWDLRGTL